MHRSPFIPMGVESCGGAYKVIERKSPEWIPIKENAGADTDADRFARPWTDLTDGGWRLSSDDGSPFKMIGYILDRNIFHNDESADPGLHVLGISLTHDEEEVGTLFDDEDDIDYPPLLGRKDCRARFAIQ